MAKSKKINTRLSEAETRRIKPLADRVLIEPMSKEEKTVSGIVLPETVDKERPEQGKVLAVGPGKTDSNGKVQKVGLKKGDVVLFTKYGPNEIEVEGNKYLIAKEEDVLAILE